MKKTRKIISLLLSVCMMASLFTFAMPITGFALAAGDSALNDGSTTLGITSSGLTHTFNHAFIGGKSGSDVAGFLNATTSAEGGDRRIYAYNNAANVRSLMSFDVMFTSENAILDIYYTRYSNEACTTNTGAKLVSITPSGGIAKGGYTMNTAVPGPTSLSLNEWHNIAVEVPNNGTNSVSIYADGKKYNCYMDGKAYGSYRFYAVVKQGSYYIDNFYKAAGEIGVAMYNEADYQISEIEVSANDKITYDADNKTFSCQEGTTVAELKNSITTDCDITVFSDNTYKTVLQDSDAITQSSALVLSKNSKVFRYYGFEVTEAETPTEPDIPTEPDDEEDEIEIPEDAIYYDGSSDLGIKSDGLTHTYGHGYIGGKKGSDVAGYLNATTQSSNSDRRISAKMGLNVRSLMSFDVLFPSENAIIDIYYMRYSNESGSTNTGARLVQITPTAGITKGGYTMNSLASGVPTSFSLNQWHNIAIEVPNDGTNLVYLYVNGKTYICYMDGKGYGAYRFYAVVYGGEYYIDNFLSYNGSIGQTMYQVSDYQISEPSASGDITFDSENKAFTVGEGTTVGALKEGITTDGNITVFADNTYKTVLADSKEISVGNVVVLSKNKRAFRYFNVVISANEDEDDSIYDYVVNDDYVSCSITGFKEGKTPAAGSDIVIPDSILGYPVTKIADGAFRVGGSYKGVKLGKVTMPDTIESIGYAAFYDTGCIIEKWPESLTTIGGKAFVYGGAMTGKFGSRLKTIGDNAFQYSGLVSPEFPDGLTTIGSYAFLWQGSGFKTVVFPDSVTSIGDYALQTSYFVSTLRFPRNETYTAISETVLSTAYPGRNDRLFGNMKIYIPETITEIPNGLLTNFKDGAKVTIYGVYGSAAYDYYLKIKAALEAGTYTNNATYPEEGSGYTNSADVDGDGKGELASISFVDYNFVSNTGCDSSDINKGDTKPAIASIPKVDGVEVTTVSANVAGVGGKKADDVVIKLNTPGGSEGENYYNSPLVGGASLKGNIFYHEISVRAPYEGYVGVQAGTYKENLSDYYGTGKHLFRVTPTAIYVNGVAVQKAVAGRWYTITSEIDCNGSKNAAVYVNGKKYETQLDEAVYGIRHFRVFPAKNDTNYDVYYDNVRAYASNTKGYYADGEKEAKVSAATEDIEIFKQGIVYADPEAVYTAGQLKAMLVTDSFARANIRIYSDDTFTTELEDTENVTNASVVVVAATNGYDIEKVISYYPVNPAINKTIYDIKIISEEEKTAQIVGYYADNITDDMDLTTVEIPAEISGYKIIEIAENAFYKNTVIKNVVIADTVEVIGKNAFGNTFSDGVAHGKIENVKLPANLKTIGAGAFQCNDSLDGVVLPFGLESIGASAFYWTGLTEISIPDSVTSIGSIAFRLCEDLTYIKLSGGVSEYTDQFYASSMSPKDVVIPKTVTSIADGTFAKYNTDTTVYGAKGSYAETFAASHGWKFKSYIGNMVFTGGIYGDGTKEIKGTDYDLDYGFENLVFKGKVTNAGNADVVANVILAVYDQNGYMVERDIQDITVKAGETLVVDESYDISVSAKDIVDGYSVKAFIWRKSNNEPLIENVDICMDSDKREIHVLGIANSFTNDSFVYLDDVAAADDVVIKATNLYIGSATLSLHYSNMKNNTSAYTPPGTTGTISVKDGLTSDKWDAVVLQGGTHGFKNEDLAFINYDTHPDTKMMYEYINDYVDTYAPGAKHIMHLSWGPCDEYSRIIYSGKYANEENARAALYDGVEAAYKYATTIYSDKENMMIPTLYAVEYALDVLGYAEHSGPGTADQWGVILYKNPTEVSLFRDETCHLTDGDKPYGRVLAALTWYEYLTGNDATQNKFQHKGIESEVMAKLKEAAHYANTLVTPITASDIYIGN